MRRAAALGAIAILAAACGSHRSTSAAAPSSISLSSPAFAAGATIPREYTCDGRDVSPPLQWSGLPPGARELALVMRDPDAPGGNFTHWTVKRIPVTTDALAAGSVPSGAVEGRNSFGTIGYRGPCPPHGDAPHHYVLTLSALSANALHAAPLATGTLTGTYGRH